ncbi:MAG TPA: hopanoid biosynthesis associated radical SAM protein HpnJ [Blastocatellia bacterium]|nr:hopanoid biosynthesis associated radical SAM protein HpnJ [Blastocatellia bacterium]
MKTLLLNPPSFEKFDGGASSRWPATREIESYWYPVWLGYPAALIRDMGGESRLLDAPPHHVSPEETANIARDYDFVVLFTSHVGFNNDVKLAEMMKNRRPDIKIAFVGPPVTTHPEVALRASEAIDFVTHKEFDFAVTEFAAGKPLDQIAGVHFLREGKMVSTPPKPLVTDLDSLPWVTPIYKRDLDITKYNVPFLLNPFIAFYSTRGCPALCTFCLWPQTFDDHRWRQRSVEDVRNEVEWALDAFKPEGLQEIFFDDDTFTYNPKRMVEMSRAFKPLKFQWSCTSRSHLDYETLKVMADAGCRLFIVGFESGNEQILKNIKKGITARRSLEFVKNCKKVGIKVHADFIIGLPGETRETIKETIAYAKEMDAETIQVSVAHAYPGTEMYEWFRANGVILNTTMSDELGQQLPMANFPHLSGAEMLEWVHKFYDEYYFRPKVVARIVGRAMFDGRERRRLYKEAREFLQTRARRRDLVKAGQV